MGSSHGSTAELSSDRVATNVRRHNVNTGTEDIDLRTVVGEGSSLERLVGGSNGDGVGSVGRRLSRDGKGSAEAVTVSGCDDGEDTLLEGGGNGVGPGGGGLATERHVNDGAGLAVLADNVVDSPVEAVEDDGSGAGSALEHLDGDQVRLLGDTVGGSTDGAGDVSAVAEGVGVLASCGVVSEGGTSAALIVGGDDTCGG